ncbi:SgcJ/EcaC family oxidoreductase [Ciceribacter thiooxidans]|uniref:SgcJ/EcaC family oxidoreductase n=1 Tax=Ciceribacter thiooxidans TaxID=1969821 RepID=A0ABV7I7L5_9HYPH|nr:SgcJ/EcaC family oxidoreductase [Ciceribacter thiooxidans]
MSEDSTVAAGSPPQLAARDMAAIRGLINDMARAWNAGDGAAYADVFTRDCDYVTFNGERLRGRDAVARSHQNLFDTHLKGSRLIVENVDVRPINNDVALVHCTGNSMLRWQKKAPKSRKSLQTLVATRTEYGWRFAAFHNTRIFKITAFRAVLMMLGL